MSHRLVREGRDDLAQSGEALVDVGPLLEPRPLRPRGLRPLRARQVHQRDAAHLLGGEPAVRVVLVLGEDDGEDGVAAAAALVHVGSGHRARLVALVHQVMDVGVLGHGQLAEVLHVGAEEGVLAHPQVALRVRVQQVTHPLTVDLHVANLHGEQHRVKHRYVSGSFNICYKSRPGSESCFLLAKLLNNCLLNFDQKLPKSPEVSSNA
jgi:hypothetical protein